MSINNDKKIAKERVEKLIDESELNKLCCNLDEWEKRILKIPGYNESDKIANFLKVIANPIRLNIVLILLERDWACNCEFEHAFKIHQTLISHHLRDLRKAKILSYSKSGQWKFYKLNDDYRPFLLNLRELLLNVIKLNK